MTVILVREIFLCFSSYDTYSNVISIVVTWLIFSLLFVWACGFYKLRSITFDIFCSISLCFEVMWLGFVKGKLLMKIAHIHEKINRFTQLVVLLYLVFSWKNQLIRKVNLKSPNFRKNQKIYKAKTVLFA